ncbi:MAG TPA: HAMP domain-containing sensor histidine kinase [Candidatus Nitrosocosmicus sp.]|nr:HAMP domain-containing sensor histidine kinase [Candidatus Nitrosocosmicus sp.]
MIHSHDYEENKPIFVKNDSSALSTEDDGLSSLSSSIESTLHSKEKTHNRFTQTTIVIEDPSETEKIFSNLVNNAKEEILVMFPSIGALTREGLFIELLNRKGIEHIAISIMSPLNRDIKNYLSVTNKHENIKQYENIAVREIAKSQRIKSTILIVDKKFLLTVELYDDSKQTFREASGLSTYSTSKPTVSSYISIFDSLWDQIELYHNLRTANEKLVESEQVEREFINTAAHELRTPTQAITGYIEMDDELFDHLIKQEDKLEQQALQRLHKKLFEHHESISRNATRLENLINNLLDVARIDSNQKNMIMLQKVKVDLVREIRDLVNFHLDQKIKDKNIKINFINNTLLKEQYWILTDRSRLNQILNNLVDNAIKFSKYSGNLDILIYENPGIQVNEKRRNKNMNKSDSPLRNINSAKSNDQNEVTEQVYVAISDSGKGISPSVLPRLFEKFNTDSDVGTGLGLYISKKLVEALGGRIWAFNNNDGIGSTFVFNLPLAAKHNPGEKDT